MREAIGRRLERLSGPCNETLTVASAIGREFELDQLDRLIDDLSEDALLEALDEALAAHLVEELPGDAGRYQFTHALIQGTLADELSRTRRARLHARIAETLEELYGAEAERHAAELAHHFGEAQAVLGPGKLVRYSALAGEAALAAHAPEQALAHFQRALAAKGDEATGRRGRRAALRPRPRPAGDARTTRAGARGRRACAAPSSTTPRPGTSGRAVAVAAYPLPLSLRIRVHGCRRADRPRV